METIKLVNPNVPKKSFIINNEFFKGIDPKLKQNIENSSEEIDSYVKKTLPKGDFIELSQDTINGEKKFLLTHIGENSMSTVTLSKADYYKASLQKSESPIKLFIDIIAENLKNLKKIKA